MRLEGGSNEPPFEPPNGKWWNELFGEGVIPTPEQFLDVMVEELKNKNKLF